MCNHEYIEQKLDSTTHYIEQKVQKNKQKKRNKLESSTGAVLSK